MDELHEYYATLPNGEELFYRFKPGKGVPVVFLHGNLSSSVVFVKLIKSLRLDHPMIAPDLRGFGQSSYHKEATEIKTYANDMKAFLDSLGYREVILVGHGTGSAVVLRLALDEPAMVSRYVLLATCSVAGHPVRQRIFFNLLKSKTPIKTLEGMKHHVEPMEKNKDNNQRWVLKQMVNTLFFNHDKPTEKTSDLFVEAIRQQRNLAAFNLAMSQFNIYSDDNGLVDGTNETRDFTQDGLIIHGDKDEIMPVGIAKFNERVMRKKPTTHILNGIGYIPFIGAQRKVCKLMETFIENAKS